MIKKFNEFDNINESFKDELKDWYDLFGRSLLSLPTLGTNILAEEGAKFLKDQYEKLTIVKKVIEKLKDDKDIKDYVKKHDIKSLFIEEEGNGKELDKKIYDKIHSVLSDNELNKFVKHLEYISNKLDKTNENLVNWKENSFNDPDNEWTVEKLIKELQKFDNDLPVRVGCQGYSNQEILGVKKGIETITDEETGHSTDDYYNVINIVGFGSILDDPSDEYYKNEE